MQQNIKHLLKFIEKSAGNSKNIIAKSQPIYPSVYNNSKLSKINITSKINQIRNENPLLGFKSSAQFCNINKNTADFEKLQTEICKDILRDKKTTKIGFTKPKDGSKPKEIEIVKLESDEDIKRFITFFAENSKEYIKVVQGKLENLNITCKTEDIYKLYFTDLNDAVSGLYPIVVGGNIAGFCSLLPYDDRLNISAYLFDEYRGQSVASQTEYHLINYALKNNRSIVGAIDNDNEWCKRSTMSAISKINSGDVSITNNTGDGHMEIDIKPSNKHKEITMNNHINRLYGRRAESKTNGHSSPTK